MDNPANSETAEPQMAGADRFERWVESVSGLLDEFRTLSREASSHGGTLGMAREFFVSDLLGKFLPGALHIGSGEIIDRPGDLSNQIDIIIYRNEFPRIPSFAYTNLFFLEGVVATIEVKSQLNKRKLKNALFNCRSVKILAANGIHSCHQHEKRFPATYVFGYQGYKQRLTDLKQAISEWIRENNIDTVTELPDLICTEGCVAIKVNIGSGLDVNSIKNRLGGRWPIYLAARWNPPIRWLLYVLVWRTSAFSLTYGDQTTLRRRFSVPLNELEASAEFWYEWETENCTILSLK